MSLIVTPLEVIEHALTRTLEREQCTSDQGCSALANVLLAALVKCKRDPRIQVHVEQEMRRLAAKLCDLADAGAASTDRVAHEARLN